MRVLIIHRYFWPDTPPYGWMLRAIAGRWANDGHDVSVLTSQPSYGAAIRGEKQPKIELLDGFVVHRVGLLPESKQNFVARGINLGLFMLRCLGHILLQRHGYDTVMAATTPPVLVAWAASLAARLRGARFIYHCQDIHPELLSYAGLLGKGLTYRFLLARDTATVNRATRVVVLSGDMRDTLLSRTGVTQSNIRIINNFTVPDYTDAGRVECSAANKSVEKFRVLFAGNLGYFQGLETVIDAARLLRDNKLVEFVFLGDGAAKSALMAQAGDMVGQTVHFLGYRPQHEAEEFVRNADLSLITLAPAIYRAAYPSKTMTYLKMGSPILALVEPESELARLITSEKVGFVSQPGDSSSVVRHILEGSRSPAMIGHMRENSQTLCEKLFSESSRLERWSALLREDAFPGTPQPVFLIGAGRSGTKFLRDMLGAANDIATVPFDVGYILRKGNEALNHDELDPETLSAGAFKYVRQNLPRLAGVTQQSRILLEKSVPNSLRVGFLRAIYPHAKFVHLIRDGRAVTESSLRQWQAPAESSYLLRKLRYFPWSNYRYALWYIGNQLRARFGGRVQIWGPRYAGMEHDLRFETLETVCARQWRCCVEAANAQLDALPADDVVTIRYEDLVSNEAVVKDLCRFVGTNDQKSVLGYYRANLRAELLEKWHANLLADQQAAVIHEIGALLDSLGYLGIDETPV